jgi:hypothetical protein
MQLIFEQPCFLLEAHRQLAAGNLRSLRENVFVSARRQILNIGMFFINILTTIK